MNEINSIRPVATGMSTTTAAKADATKKTLGDMVLKTSQDVKTAEKPEPSPALPEQDKGAQLHDAVNVMNDFVQSVKRELQFTVDEELGRTVVKVVDSASGDLIRQIPDEIFLDLARKVKESGEMHLLNATG
jgi:flagellar protein FlaG